MLQITVVTFLHLLHSILSLLVLVIFMSVDKTYIKIKGENSNEFNESNKHYLTFKSQFKTMQ